MVKLHSQVFVGLIHHFLVVPILLPTQIPYEKTGLQEKAQSQELQQSGRQFALAVRRIWKGEVKGDQRVIKNMKVSEGLLMISYDQKFQGEFYAKGLSKGLLVIIISKGSCMISLHP